MLTKSIMHRQNENITFNPHQLIHTTISARIWQNSGIYYNDKNGSEKNVGYLYREEVLGS